MRRDKAYQNKNPGIYYNKNLFKLFFTLVFIIFLSASTCYSDSFIQDSYDDFYAGGNGTVNSAAINGNELPADINSGKITLDTNTSITSFSSWEDYPSFSKNVETQDFGIGVSASFGDVNGDGYIDMVVGGTASISLYENTDTSASKKHPSWTLKPSALPNLVYTSIKPILIDLDKDGLLDIVYGYTMDRFASEYGIVAFMKNIGTNTTPDWGINSTSKLFLFDKLDGNGARSSIYTGPAPAFADLNNDGNLDIVIGSINGTLSWYKVLGFKTDGNVNAQLISTLDTGLKGYNSGSHSTPALKDFDGDGDFDLAVGTLDGSIDWFRNKGTVSAPIWESWPSFGDGTTTPGVLQGSTPSFADLDNDGDFDLLVGDLYGFFKWYRKNSSPYFSSGTYTSPIYTTGWSMARGVLDWSEVVSSNTSLSLEVRSSDQADMLGASAWGDCYISKSTLISNSKCINVSDTYIQYRASLSTLDQKETPILDSVVINYDNLPFLAYSKTLPDFSNGLSPDTGVITDNYTFKVLYFSQTIPDTLLININIDGTDYPMTSDPANDGNFTNSELYTFTHTGYAVKNIHTYSFSASESSGPTASLPESDENFGPWILDSPITPKLFFSPETGFIDDGVDPDTGYINTTNFSYKVVFIDPSNTAPNSVNIIINGVSVSMSVDINADLTLNDGNFANGEQYLFSPKNFLSDSITKIKNYYFSVSYGNPSASITLPKDASPVTGPHILSGPLKIIIITPNQGLRGDELDFYVYGRNFTNDMDIRFIPPGIFNTNTINTTQPIVLQILDPASLPASHIAYDVCKSGNTNLNFCYELSTKIKIDPLITDAVIASGPWDVTIENRFDNKTDTRPLAFKINKPMGNLNGIRDLQVCNDTTDLLRYPECEGATLPSDCALTAPTCNISLTWTPFGAAAYYDARYSDAAINPDGTNWNFATQFFPGTKITANDAPPLNVTLNNNQAWDIGVMSTNMALNASMSNVLSIVLGDYIVPDTVVELQASLPAGNDAEDTVNLVWTSVADNPNGDVVKLYEIRYSLTKPIYAGIFQNYSTATFNVPSPLTVTPGVTVHNTNVSGLLAGRLYYFDIVAVDGASNKSNSNTGNFGCTADVGTPTSTCKKTDLIEPEPIFDLRAYFKTIIQLSNDGNSDLPNSGGFNAGIKNGVLVSGTGQSSKIELLPAINSGDFISNSIDLKKQSNFEKVSWTAFEPDGLGVNIAVQLAGNNDNTTWNFSGPDGTGLTFYSPGDFVHQSLNGNRYVKYKITLNRSIDTVFPSFNDISIETDGEIKSLVSDSTLKYTTWQDFFRNGIPSGLRVWPGSDTKDQNINVTLLRNTGTTCPAGECGTSTVDYDNTNVANSPSCRINGGNYQICFDTQFLPIINGASTWDVRNFIIRKSMHLYNGNPVRANRKPLLIRSTGYVQIYNRLDISANGQGDGVGANPHYSGPGQGEDCYDGKGQSNIRPKGAGGGGFGGEGGHGDCIADLTGPQKGYGGKASINNDLSGFPVNVGGSAGSGGSSDGGGGGGAIKIVSNAYINVGSIFQANGGNVVGNSAATTIAGGGSGGSIYLKSYGHIALWGTINAIGGNTTKDTTSIGYGGGGGGGIIRIEGEFLKTQNGKINVSGGKGSEIMLGTSYGSGSGSTGRTYIMYNYRNGAVLPLHDGTFSTKQIDLGTDLIESISWIATIQKNTSLSMDVRSANTNSPITDCSDPTLTWSGWEEAASASGTVSGYNEITAPAILYNKKCVQIRFNFNSKEKQYTPVLSEINIQTIRNSDRNIKLTWSAPCDNGLATANCLSRTEKVASYDLRISENPITNNAEFNTAKKIPDLITPSAVGTRENFTVSIGAGERLDQLVLHSDFNGTVGSISDNAQIASVVGPFGTASNPDSLGMSYGIGKSDQAVLFDGTDDYINFFNPSSLQTTGDMTISMWVKPSVIDVNRTLYSKSAYSEGEVTILSAGTLRYSYGTCGDLTPPACLNFQEFDMTSPLVPNVWTHISLVRDLKNMKLLWYKNGLLTNETTPLYASATISTKNAYVGKGSSATISGFVDELSIYSRALFAVEIKQYIDKHGLHFTTYSDFYANNTSNISNAVIKGTNTPNDEASGRMKLKVSSSNLTIDPTGNIAASGVDRFRSVTDSRGFIHVGYNISYQTWYATNSPDGIWKNERVSPSGRYGDIAVDSKDNIYISFGMGNTLRFFKGSFGNWGTIIDTGVLKIDGYGPAMAMDSKDVLHFIYQISGGTYNNNIGHAYWDTIEPMSVPWANERVGWADAKALYLNIDIGPDDTIYILYSQNYPGRGIWLKSGKKANWQQPRKQIMDTHPGGYPTDIVVDINNKIHIAILDGTMNSATLRGLYYHTNKNGAWEVTHKGREEVRQGAVAIETDSLAQVHITYTADKRFTSSPLKYYKINSSGTWKPIQTLDSGSYSAIAVDKSDGVHIHYNISSSPLLPDSNKIKYIRTENTYFQPGIYTSPVITLDQSKLFSSDLSVLSWNVDLPSDTSAAVKVRAGNSTDTNDGSWSTWRTVSQNGGLPSGSAFAGTNLQYEVTLNRSTDQKNTPAFNDISIQVECITSEAENCTVDTLNDDTQVLLPSKTYYFAIKSTDDAGAKSNINTGIFGCGKNSSAGSTCASTDSTDLVKPNAVTDLLVSGKDLNLTLSWSAPGDDGKSSVLPASSYDIRLFNTNDITEENWYVNGIPFSGVPVRPAKMGNPETFSFKLTMPSASTDYYFALRSKDDAGNVSQISNISKWSYSIMATPMRIRDQLGNAILDYDAVTVLPGGALIMEEGETVNIKVINVNSKGAIFVNKKATINVDDMTIDAGGFLSANGRGCRGETVDSALGTDDGPYGWDPVNQTCADPKIVAGVQGVRNDTGGEVSSHGGWSAGGNGSPAYGNLFTPFEAGAGAGGNTGSFNNTAGKKIFMKGGNGGGAIRLNVSGNLILNGEISSDGESGDRKSGGGGSASANSGSGGSIYITAGTLTGAGKIHSDSRINSAWAKTGAGGRIAIYYDKFSTFDQDQISVNSNYNGMKGTIHYKHPEYDLPVIIDSTLEDLIVSSNTTWTPGTYKYKSVTINSGVTLTIDKRVTIESEAFTVNGTLSAVGTGCGAIAESAWSIVGSGPDRFGSITCVTNTQGATFSSSTANPPNPYVGAAYGGKGGFPTLYNYKFTNVYGTGNEFSPLDIGSGGGFSGSVGGGAIRIRLIGSTGKLINNGLITANGQRGDYGGGSGGSIYITAKMLEGVGSVIANGGAGGKSAVISGGGGGGGRVVLNIPDVPPGGLGAGLLNYRDDVTCKGGTGTNGLGYNGTCYLLPLPSNIGVLPSRIGQGAQKISITVSGDFIREGISSIEISGTYPNDKNDLTDDITSDPKISYNFNSATNKWEILANVSIGQNVPVGTYDIIVKNMHLGAGVGAGILTITNAPEIINLSPDQAQLNDKLLVNINGNYFQDGVITYMPGMNFIEKQNSPTVIKTELAIDSVANLGWNDMTITNPDGGTSTFVDAFYVLADSTPSNKIQNLSAQAVSGDPGSADLTWSAPGNNGTVGNLTSGSKYHIKYSEKPIVESTAAANQTNWADAVNVSNTIIPQPNGNPEVFNITGLNGNTLYYFAVKTEDGSGNLSFLSNIASTTTDNVTGPPEKAVFAVKFKSDTAVILEWQRPVSGNPLTSYDVRYSSVSINVTNWDNGSIVFQATGEPLPASASGTLETLIISGLSTGGTYWFAITSTDNSAFTSDISDPFSVSLNTTDSIPPADISNLLVLPGSVTSNSLRLKWTAPGDDDVIGTASSYTVKYARKPILESNATCNDVNWDGTNQIPVCIPGGYPDPRSPSNLVTNIIGKISPSIAGSNEFQILSGTDPSDLELASNTLYYFNIKTSDEVPNTSNLASVLSGQVSQRTALIRNNGNYLGVSKVSTDMRVINIFNKFKRSTDPGPFLYQFNPLTFAWETVTGDVIPGKGYYLYLPDMLRVIDDQTMPFSDNTNPYVEITFPAGWNLISNPYSKNINIHTGIDFIQGVTTYDFSSAVSSFKIDSVFSYDNGTNLEVEKEELEPWKAYWIYLYEGMTFRFNKP